MPPSGRQGRDRAEALLIDQWGRMAPLWGVTPSSGRIAGLLLARPSGLTQEAVARRLGISQGHASTALRELLAWGLAHKIRAPGERRDRYEVEGDTWALFLAVLRERRRREFDPMLSTLQACLDALGHPRHAEGRALKTRLERARAFYEVMHQLAHTISQGGERLLRLLARVPVPPGGRS